MPRKIWKVKNKAKNHKSWQTEKEISNSDLSSANRDQLFLAVVCHLDKSKWTSFCWLFVRDNKSLPCSSLIGIIQFGRFLLWACHNQIINAALKKIKCWVGVFGYLFTDGLKVSSIRLYSLLSWIYVAIHVIQHLKRVGWVIRTLIYIWISGYLAKNGPDHTWRSNHRGLPARPSCQFNKQTNKREAIWATGHSSANFCKAVKMFCSAL